MPSKKWEPNRVEQRIVDILTAIEDIRSYVGQTSRGAFLEERMRQDAVARQLLIIAEATDKIFNLERRFGVPDEQRIAIRLPSIPWQEIRALGIRVRHIYGEIEPEALWGIVAGGDLDRLESALRSL